MVRQDEWIAAHVRAGRWRHRQVSHMSTDDFTIRMRMHGCNLHTWLQQGNCNLDVQQCPWRDPVAKHFGNIFLTLSWSDTCQIRVSTLLDKQQRVRRCAKIEGPSIMDGQVWLGKTTSSREEKMLRRRARLEDKDLEMARGTTIGSAQDT